MWDNICRLCSSRGDYDIFSIIPSYLHASPNEFLLWQKPINKLLEETTGLLVDVEDGLPQKMCALCISYLKHAATFRQQAINNAISLKAVSILSVRNKPTSKRAAYAAEDSHDDKASVLITANDLAFSDERKTDTNRLVNILNNQSSKITKSDESMKKILLGNNKGNHSSIKSGIVPVDENEDVLAMTYLNLLFDKDTNTSARKMKRHQQPVHRRPQGDNNLAAIFDEINNTTSDPLGEEFQTASSDENEAFEQKKNFFSYKEKNFEEDDVMDLDELKEANITINIPETCKERKCRACFRRFMFEESYKEHMNMCIEYKFLLFIEEINRLLDIRRSKAVSPHEFIRRMIFCLRKTCQWLNTSCGEILLPDLCVGGETKKRIESDGKNSTAEISSGGNSDETTEKFAQDGDRTVVERNKSILGILKKNTKSLQLQDKASEDTYLKLFKASNNIKKSTPDRSSHTEDKHNVSKPNDNNLSLENGVKFKNILTLIDSAESNAKPSISNILLLQDLEGNKTNTNGSKETENKTKSIDERSNFFEKLKNASLPQRHVTRKNPFMHANNFSFPSRLGDIKFSARCNTCNTVFDSVASLEEHNANFHNHHAAKICDEHEKIISMFDGDNAKK